MSHDHIKLRIFNTNNVITDDEFTIFIKPRNVISLTHQLVDVLTQDTIDTLVNHIFNIAAERQDETSVTDLINHLISNNWLILDDGKYVNGIDYVDYCQRHGSLEIGRSYVLTINGFLPLLADI